MLLADRKDQEKFFDQKMSLIQDKLEREFEEKKGIILLECEKKEAEVVKKFEEKEQELEEKYETNLNMEKESYQRRTKEELRSDYEK